MDKRKREENTEEKECKEQRITNEGEQTAYSLMFLPIDVIIEIILLLGLQSLLKFRQTCKQNHRIIESYFIWHHYWKLTLPDKPIPNNMSASEIRNILFSNIRKRCFSCHKNTIGFCPPFQGYLCYDCRGAREGRYRMVSETYVKKAFKLKSSDLKDLPSMLIPNSYRVMCCYYWIEHIKQKALQIHGSQDELNKELMKSKKKSQAIKLGKARSKEERKLVLLKTLSEYELKIEDDLFICNLWIKKDKKVKSLDPKHVAALVYRTKQVKLHSDYKYQYQKWFSKHELDQQNFTNHDELHKFLFSHIITQSVIDIPKDLEPYIRPL